MSLGLIVLGGREGSQIICNNFDIFFTKCNVGYAKSQSAKLAALLTAPLFVILKFACE